MNQEKESRMTLQAVITLDGVYAGFAGAKTCPTADSRFNAGMS